MRLPQEKKRRRLSTVEKEERSGKQKHHYFGELFCYFKFVQMFNFLLEANLRRGLTESKKYIARFQVWFYHKYLRTITEPTLSEKALSIT